MSQQCLSEAGLLTRREGYDGCKRRVWNCLIHRRRRPVGYAIAVYVVPGTIEMPGHGVCLDGSDLSGELSGQANTVWWPTG
jgi:hypothetical protein